MTRAVARSRRISATPAPARCRASRLHAAAAGRSPPRRRSPSGASPLSRSLRKAPSGSVGTPLYDGWVVGLKLLVGPANAGKVSQLLERYLSALDREPILIVPTGSDVERVERELVAKQGCVFGGTIGTFDDVFERVAADGGGRRVATEAQQQLVLRRAVARASLNGLSASAGSTGFA